MESAVRARIAALGGLETRVALDDDRDGRQMIQIRFQAYKRGTGKYPKGYLYIYLDDLTCELLDYDLLW